MTRLGLGKNARGIAIEQEFRGKNIAGATDSLNEGTGAILSLVFAKGGRPDAMALASLAELANADFRFSITHNPGASAGWLELLAMGLTFDCHGLAPAEAVHEPLRGTLLGLRHYPAGEAVTVRSAPHLWSGRGLLPVVSVLAQLGCALSILPDVLAVCWEPARCWMEPEYFRKVIQDWQQGGAFPALGLTTLRRESNGAMVSAGLDLLIGQELRFEPDRGLPPAAVARIAVRLIHELVSLGPVENPREFTGPGGETLLAVPVLEGRQLRVLVRR